jgi:hypothetical protein
MKAWQPLTRGGYEYRIYAVHDDGQVWPIHGAVKDGSMWLLRSWMKDGHTDASDNPSSFDLLPALPEKRVLKGWVNVYLIGGECRISGPYNSRENARDNAGVSATECLYIEHEYTTGEGL